jgi:hypothetical protein
MGFVFSAFGLQVLRAKGDRRSFFFREEGRFFHLERTRAGRPASTVVPRNAVASPEDGRALNGKGMPDPFGENTWIELEKKSSSRR